MAEEMFERRFGRSIVEMNEGQASPMSGPILKVQSKKFRGSEFMCSNGWIHRKIMR